MKHYLLLALMFVCAALMACDQPATPMEFGSVCTPENDGKAAAVTGYFFDDGHMFCSNTSGRMECSIKFAAKPGDEKGFSAEIEQGTWANDVEKVESSYKTSDIKIHDNSGAILSLSDKVKITGKISTTPDNSVCFLTVKKIEKQ
jgi:hypothetical protein